MTIQLTYQLLIGQLIMRFFLKTLAYLKEKQYLCRAKATISALEEKKPTHRKHNPRHDYKERCIYHITLVVSDRCKVLGRIIDARDKGLDLKKVSQPNGEVHCRYRWERDQDTEARRAHQNESVMKARQGMPWSRHSSVRMRRQYAISACKRGVPDSSRALIQELR